MKYKDRKHAKRKYKQALLATVATMTLGVSTLGSTASVFAEEVPSNHSFLHPQKEAVADAATTKEKLNKLAELDKSLQSLAKDSGAANYKLTIDLFSKSLPVFVNDLNKGNFNNTARTLTLYGTSLIPYGALFVTPILGLLWPEHKAQDFQMQKLVEEISSMIDKKIEINDLNKLKAETDALMGLLGTFQGEMNDRYSKVTDVKISDNRSYANQINTGFKNLIEKTKVEGHQFAELPIFTMVATAYLTFLNFMENQAIDHPKLKMDSGTLKTYYPNFKETAKKYKDYVHEIYYNKTKALHNKTGGTIDVRNAADVKSLQDLGNIGNLTVDNAAFLLALNPPTKGDKIGFVRDGDKMHYYSPQDGTRNLRGEKFKKGELITHFIDINDKRYLFSENDETKNSDGKVFKKGDMVTGWYKTFDGDWYYFDPESGIAATGWKEISGKKHFFYHDFVNTGAGEGFGGKGKMITNRIVTIDGKLYKFDENGAYRQVGWSQKGDRYYYISTGKTQNSAGKTFKLGENVTGWLKDNKDGNYYYLSPEDGTKNDTGKVFNKGEMMIGWVEIEGKWYYLDNKEGNQDFKGPEGRMLHGVDDEHPEAARLQYGKRSESEGGPKAFLRSFFDKNGAAIIK
ncbi:insecticidal delta-endotoxin Cry8Ea1 family protein [Bacillus thuringiensis]|uniref:insecticidal delta-endotoxin Cry8Ea1 family protein n=1 Tax=Bacillus thuringiensis TaxID=1428 RepID=UPI0013E5F579|nr:insecticidal delta-endotoxin Cry8Ea1 family protein [Bacillus thuringiensis]